MDDKELIKKVTKLILSGETIESRGFGSGFEEYVIPAKHTKELANVLKCEIDSGGIDSALSTLVSKYSDIFSLYNIVTIADSTIIKYNGQIIFYDVGNGEPM